MEQVTIRVPATTANLAAGFDVLGCALGLHNTHTDGVASTVDTWSLMSWRLGVQDQGVARLVPSEASLVGV